jgi:hypothetical protein
MSIWSRALMGVGFCVLLLLLRAIVKSTFALVRVGRTVRELMPSIQKHADAAYEMFVAAPERWVVFRGIPSEWDVARLPRLDKWVWGRKPFGPYSFRVPALADGVVTVFGVSLDCGPELFKFIWQKDKEANALVDRSDGE